MFEDFGSYGSNTRTDYEQEMPIETDDFFEHTVAKTRSARYLENIKLLLIKGCNKFAISCDIKIFSFLRLGLQKILHVSLWCKIFGSFFSSTYRNVSWWVL